MPLVALIVTDAHNTEALVLGLPAGTTYTLLELTEAEWAKSPARLASEYLLPIAARSQQERRPVTISPAAVESGCS